MNTTKYVQKKIVYLITFEELIPKPNKYMWFYSLLDDSYWIPIVSALYNDTDASI